MLKFKNVSKNFGPIQALTDISFAVEPGEFVFITGPSGAGKTTLLRLLISQIRPSEGEIYFDGLEVHKLKSRQIPHLRRDIGPVFQDYKLLSDRTIFENALVALAVKGTPKPERDPRVEQVLSLVGLSERANLFPSQLSGGELQRAALARALVVNPKLVFADEPTGNLDPKTAEGIMELLQKINEEGKTVIVTTHSTELVDKMKKREIVIEEGKLSRDSDPKDLEEKEKEVDEQTDKVQKDEKEPIEEPQQADEEEEEK